MIKKLTVYLFGSALSISGALLFLIGDVNLLLPARADNAEFDMSAPQAQSGGFKSSGSKGESGTTAVPATNPESKDESAPAAPSASNLDVPSPGSAEPAADVPAPSSGSGQAAAKTSNAKVDSSAKSTTKIAKAQGNTRGQQKGMLSRLMGAMIEAPQDMYRHSVSELHQGVDDMTNKSSNPYMRFPATVISLPFCMTAGCVEGALQAFKGGDGTVSTAEAAGKKREKVAGKAPATLAE